MQDKLKRVVVVILTLLLALVTLAPVWATELDDLKRQQQEVGRRIEQYKKDIKDKKVEITNLNQQLAQLDRDIAQTEQRLSQINSQLDVALAELDKTEKDLTRAQAEQEERLKILAGRLVAIYKDGSVSRLEVLLQSTSFTDFLVRYDLLQKIAEQDVVLLQEIEARRQEIEAQMADLEVKRARLSFLQTQAEEQKLILEDRQDEKAVLLASAQEEKKKIERALAAEEEASRQLASKIRQLESKRAKQPFVGGKFAWPLPGYYSISSDFGWRNHPILGGRRFHDGIDIPAPSGTQVIAAAAGEVIFAGWYGAYGNAVIISHGGNITTLYAHLSRILVGEGDQVSKGKAVGRVGTTGVSTGNHLHFGVRKSGEPVNPWNYVK